MKKTYRDDWRVIIEIAPRATRIKASDLGFKFSDSDLDGTLDGFPFEIQIAPRRLGDIDGAISMSDTLASGDIDGDYQRRCEAMLAEMVRHPHVKSGRVTCKETHTCSHCGDEWEALSADDVADPANVQDLHSVQGEPVCCEEAIAEFRTERGIPQVST